MGDLGLIPGLGRSPGEGKGYPFQYSGLGNFMDGMVRGGHKDLFYDVSLQRPKVIKALGNKGFSEIPK